VSEENKNLDETPNNAGFNEFINAKMFTTLSGCIFIVCALVQGFKDILPYSALTINIICSLFVAMSRIAFLEEYAPKQIFLGLLQTIPIMLGATGIYEFLKHI
jgi:hypothetical protein